MDNLTHSLCGWAIARTGVSQLGAWATPTLIVAANFPDVENIISPEGTVFSGFWARGADYLAYHRGLSHSLLGLGVEALLLTLSVWLIGRVFKLHDRPKLWAALLVSTLGLGSHLALDWFNTYGVRPFLPWDGTWYYGDLAFIVDPWMWLLLGGAVYLGEKSGRWSRRVWIFLAALMGCSMFLGVRHDHIPWALFIIWSALVLLLVILRAVVFSRQAAHTPARALLLLWTVYVCVLFLCSRSATLRAMQHLAEASPGQKQLMKISANPTPGIPWRYTILAQTEKKIQAVDVDLWRAETRDRAQRNVNLHDPILAQVEGDPMYQAWLVFARHPVWEVVGSEVRLGDMRYQLKNRSADWSQVKVPLKPPAHAP